MPGYTTSPTIVLDVYYNIMPLSVQSRSDLYYYAVIVISGWGV